MTAVSFVMNRGVDGFTMTDVTVGSAAPSSGDIELRFNVLDASAGTFNLNADDIYRALKAFERWVISRSGVTGGHLYTAITNQPSGPPN